MNSSAPICGRIRQTFFTNTCSAADGRHLCRDSCWQQLSGRIMECTGRRTSFAKTCRGDLEAKSRKLYDPATLRPFISRVNAIRRENEALQSNDSLRFHSVDNDQLICYSKKTADKKNVILTLVNLDPVWPQSGFVELPMEELGFDVRHPYQMVDLLSGAKFRWQGSRNYVELRPHEMP